MAELQIGDDEGETVVHGHMRMYGDILIDALTDLGLTEVYYGGNMAFHMRQVCSAV